MELVDIIMFITFFPVLINNLKSEKLYYSFYYICMLVIQKLVKYFLFIYIEHFMKKTLISLFIIINFLSVNAQNINFDKKIGEKQNKTVESQMGIYQNEKMNAYIDSLGQRLIAHLDKKLFDYKFRLVLQEAPNAFALPGGYIYVTTGIIPLLENEDELACIIGHEIIHSNNRHGTKKIRRNIPFVILEIPGILVGIFSETAGAILEAPVKITNAFYSASYSRKLETEADDQGIILAAKAGYDPNALPDILSRMIKAIEKVTGNEETKSYFDDHPYTPDRNENIYKHIKDIDIHKTKHISNNFLKEFDGIIIGESASKGIIRENKFLHPDIDFYVEFPKDWVIENQPNAIFSHDTIKKSALTLSIEDPNISPRQAGANFLNAIDHRFRNTLVDSMDYVQNGEKGYMIRFSENTSQGVMSAFVLWMPLNGNIYKFTGISPKENHSIVENATKSLRILTEDEKNSIMQKHLSLVIANGDENIAQLSKRTGNKLDPELTAIINSIDPKEKIKKGEQIKIVVEELYVK